MKWLLLFVYIFKGEIVTDTFEFQNLTQCNTSMETLVQDATEERFPVLVAECMPLSIAWELNPY